MISNSFNFEHFKKEIWKIYFSLSLFIGALFFCASYFVIGNDLSSLFFIIAFTVISYSFRKRVAHDFWFLVELEAVSICLYLQFICLIAHFYSSKSIGMMFLATVPMLAALVNFNMHQFDRKDTDRFEIVIYLSSFLIIGSVVASLSHASSISFSDWLPFAVFTIWILGSSYYLWSSYQHGQKSFMIHLIRQSHKSEDQSESEKFFFHDLINQTHGLRLFLESYQIKGQDVEFEKISLLLSEIKILQDHLSSHFGKAHRNLEERILEVSLNFAHMLVENLVQTYLPDNRVKVEYQLEEGLCESVFWLNGQIQMHRFHRIITNLVKNVAEYRSRYLKVLVYRENDNIVYSFHNPLSVQELHESHIGKFLANSILDTEKKRNSGIGLSSVNELVEKLGGEFEFTIQDSFWVATLKVPVKEKINLTKLVA